MRGLIISLLIGVSFGLFGQVSADFSANTTQGCAPLVVKFTNNSLNSNDWTWEFSGLPNSTLQSPTIVFSQPGLYTVKLTAKNGASSDTKTETNYIRVTAPPLVNFSVNDTDGCAPHVGQFTDLSIPQSGNITNWFWSFGNGQVSTDQNPVTTFTEAKKYPVYLKVTDVNGCESSIIKSDYIQVEGPIADFNLDSVVCSLPATVAITNSNISTANDYFWDFGDGSFSTSASPLNHTYNTFNTFPIKLKVVAKQTGCSDSIQKNVHVQAYKPIFDIDVTCNDTGYTVILEDKTVPQPTTNVWDLGDGKQEFDNKIVIYNYANRATHSIKLTAKIDESCIGDTTITYGPPSAVISVPTLSCSPPFKVDFNNNSTGANITYNWAFDDTISSTLKEPSYTFPTPPVNHKAKLTVTDSFACTDDHVVNIEAPFPIADYHTKDSVYMGCAPLSVTFMDTSYIFTGSTILKYRWEAYDATSGVKEFESQSASPTHVFNTPGEYTIKYYIETNDGCIDSLIDTARIKAGVDPTSTDFNFNPATVCFGDNVGFTSSQVFANPIYQSNYWCWSFEGDGNPLMNDKETLPDDCASSLAKFNNPYLPFQTLELPNHDYSNYEYQKVDTTNGKIYISDVSPVAGNRFVHLITGYNGCYREVIKPININPTIAMPGYVFSDTDSTYLFACNENKTIGFFNDSKNYDQFNYFQIRSNGAVLQNIGENDTVFYTFTGLGKYQIVISVTNTSTGCTDSTIREFVYEQADLKYIQYGLTCAEKSPLLFDDNSSPFYPSTNIIGRKWILDNQHKYTAVSDSSLLPFPDTGYFEVDFKLFMGSVHDKIFSESPRTARCFARLDSATYVHGIKFNAWSDSLFYCGGESVQFRDSSKSTDPITFRRWDFDLDSVFSNKQDTVIVYNQTDLHNVQLKLENSYGCVDSITLPVIRVNKPTADFISYDTTICQNSAQSLINKSTGSKLSYKWYIESDIRTNRDISHTFSNLGNIDVKLVVIDDSLCADSITKTGYIQVVGKQTTLFEADTQNIDCPPLAVQFSDTSANPQIKKWFWEFGDGQTSQSQNPLNVYSTPGEYDVRLITFNEAECPDTLVKKTYINIGGPKGTAGIDKSVVCLPDTNTFSVSLVNAEYYIWNFGDGQITSYAEPIDGSTIKHSYENGGTYIPKLDLIDANGCFFTLPEFNPILADSIDARFNLKDTIQCDIHNIQFANPSRYTFPQNFDWRFGDGDSSFVATPTHSYKTSGTYLLTLKMESQLGCIDSVEQNFIINEAPESSISIINSNYCIPSNTTFKVSISNNTFSLDSMILEANGATVYGDSMTTTFVNATAYDFKSSIYYGKGTCILDTIINLKFYEYPIADFSFSPINNSLESPNVNFTNNSQNATIFNWDFGDNKTSDIESPGHNYDHADDYKVRLIVSNEGGCFDTSDVALSVAPYNFVKLPSAFSPNGDGFNDQFGVLHAGDLEVTHFVIYNRWGQKVFETNNKDEKWDGTFRNKKQDAGTYVYYVKALNKGNKEIEIKGNFSLLR